MSESPNTAPKPASSRKKKLMIAAGIIVAIPVLLYFILTSSAFIKGFILPKAGSTLNATITVEDISVSPFSAVSLRGLKVATTGEPLLTADSASVRYSLMDIIGGKLSVSEMKIQAPTVKIIKNADGTSNLDAITKALAANTAKPEAKTTSSGKKATLNLKNIALENAHFVFAEANKEGGKQNIELKSINLTVDQVMNGIAGKLQLGTEVLFDKQLTAKSPQDRIETKANASFEFVISADMMPQTIKGSAELKVGTVKGAFNELADLIGTLNIDMTATELKAVKLAFTQKGTSLGGLSISGPFDAVKGEGTLAINIDSIEKQVLNLVGAPMGLDFGNTRLTSANTLKLTQGGKQVAFSGQFNALKFSIHKGDLTMKPLDLSMSYALNFDSNASATQIDTLKLTGTQGSKTLLDIGLTEPLKISTKSSTPEIGKSSLYVKVNELDLADWQAVLGKTAPAGKISVNLNASAEDGGKQIAADLSTTISGLKVLAGTNAYENLGASFKTQLTLQGMTNLNLAGYDVQLSVKKDELVHAQGRGTVNLASLAMQLETTTEAHFAPAIALLHLPDIKLQSGSVKAAININQSVANKSTNMTVTGNVTLANLSGKLTGIQLNKLQAATDFNVGIANNQDVSINKMALALQHANKPAGNLEASGTYSLAKSSGKIDYTLTDLNENLLGALLAPALTNASLTSISINSKGSAAIDPTADTSIKTDLNVSRLVVTDKAGKLPKDPLALGAKLDIAMAKQVIDLKNIQLNLTPTDRARNEVTLTGKVDTSKTNAISGNLKLASDGLDFTRYYDLFAGNTAPTSGKPAPTETKTTTPAPAATPETEAAPITLPVSNFRADIDIKKLYLREIAAEKWLTTVLINGSHVKVEPAQLTLNNAPVNAKVDLDLSVPGYRYDITAKATKIPLAPIANSFAPDYKDRAAGDLSTDINVKGAGATGKSLQKNLTGNIWLNFTNANIQIVEKGKFYPTINFVAFALRVPELLKSPLDAVDAKATLGNGEIEIQSAGVHSPAFIAATAGKIKIADNIKDSKLNLPVDISLAAGLAKHLSITDRNPSSAYVQLPSFLTITGTIEKIDYDKKETVIAGLLLKSVGALPLDIGEKGNNILKGVGNVLTGQPMTTNSTPHSATNAPSQTTTNKPGVLDVIDFFKKKK